MSMIGHFITISLSWLLVGSIVSAMIHGQFKSGYKYNRNQRILVYILCGPFSLFYIALSYLIDLFKAYDTGMPVDPDPPPCPAKNNWIPAENQPSESDKYYIWPPFEGFDIDVHAALYDIDLQKWKVWEGYEYYILTDEVKFYKIIDKPPEVDKS